MNVLNIENLTKTFGDRVLFRDISLGVNDNDRIGIVGVNGTGKSSLLKMIAGEMEWDSGDIIKGRDKRIAYLPQSPDFEGHETILNTVLCDNKFDLSDWETESKAKTILTKLGITEFDKEVCELSGGQKKRVALCKTLMHESDILILDEPTNHLDHETINWLEEYLKNYKGVFLMVTHDRYFLDAVTNRIVEIAHHKLYSYDTNYAGYLEKKIEREEAIDVAEQKRQNLLRNELKWVRRGAQARSTKQKARLERFEQLNAMKPLEHDKKVSMESVQTRLGKKTIFFENISKSYGDRQIVNQFNYNLIRNDRIGIIGDNGCGKTTLLKMMVGELVPDSGTIEYGDTIKIGYFSQENENLPQNERVIDYVRDIAEYLPTSKGLVSASVMLERFLFTPDMQYTPIEKLSGGEQRRLYLLSVLMEAPNVIVLDEPTNDLDISTLEILEEYLDSFLGIVITVSHDRYFLDRVVNRIFAFEDNGCIRQYEGGYSDYKDHVKDQMKSTGNNKKNDEARMKWEQEKQQKANAKLKFSYKEQREYETIDADIFELEEKIALIDKEIEQKASAYDALSKLYEEKKALEIALEEKMERWIYLNDLAEKIAGKNPS